MSKDLQNNERYLKVLADKYKLAPPPLVWNEIEQNLDKDKDKRRPFPILWIFGVLFMGALILFNLRGNKDNVIAIVEQESITSDNQKQSDQNPRNIRTANSEAIYEMKQGRKANISETTPLVSDKQEEQKVDSKKSKLFASQQHQLKDLNTSIENQHLITNTNHINTYTTDRPLLVNTETNQSNVIGINTNEEILSPRMLTPSTEPTSEERHNIHVAAIQRLEWMQKLFETEITLTQPNENLTALLSSDPKDIASLATSWFVVLGAGIGRNLSNPVLIDPTQGEFRLNTESRWYSWSTSIQLGYQIDKRWYTIIGFDINQTKSKFDFWRRDISNLMVSNNQSIQTTKSDFFSFGEVNYTFLDAGISLGRRVNIDKWHFSLEGGAIFNVLFNANGKVHVGGLEFSRLEDQEDYFNSQIGIGARLSAMLDYPISDQLWISLGPIYHQYFNTVSSDENSLKERNAILQVKAKVRYHF